MTESDVGHDLSDHIGGEGLGSRPDARPVNGFGWALGLVALASGAALALAGEPLPAPGPVLLLALAVALCINRFAFFSSEIAATAEVSVLLAAVVGFRHGAWLVGPLAVALLVGPLDALHWERRSFVRMAYNAGNRASATLAAALVFALVLEPAGDGSTTVLLVAMLAAAVAFAVVDSGITVTLLLIQGEPSVRAATAHVLELDALTVPLALAGAAAGILATEIGWWAAAPVFVPLAFVPELALARTGWRGVAVRNAVMTAVLGAIAVVVVAQLSAPDAAIALLAVLAAALGTELAVDAHAPVPPLLALVVIAAVVMAHGRLELFTAVLVAVVGTLTAWVSSATHRRHLAAGSVVLTALCATVLAAAGAALGASADDLVRAARGPVLPGPGASFGHGAAFPFGHGAGFPFGHGAGVLLAPCAAGAVFAVGVVAVGSRPHRGRAVRDLVWLAPALGVAAALASAWRVLGGGPVGLVMGAAAFGVGVFAALTSFAWWAAPAWRSRRIGGAVASRSRAVRAGGRHLTVIVIGAAAALTAAMAASLVTGELRAILVLGAVAGSESVVGMVTVGVRQWRFAPRRRTVDVALLLIAAGSCALGYPSPGVAGEWWAPAVLGAGLVVALVCGAPLARVADRGTRQPSARSRSGPVAVEPHADR